MSDAIRLGTQAADLLNSEMFVKVMDSVRLQAYRDFANSAPEDPSARESAYYLLQAIEKLTSNLNALIDNAKIEERKTEQAAT